MTRQRIRRNHTPEQKLNLDALADLRDGDLVEVVAAEEEDRALPRSPLSSATMPAEAPMVCRVDLNP